MERLTYVVTLSLIWTLFFPFCSSSEESTSNNDGLTGHSRVLNDLGVPYKVSHFHTGNLDGLPVQIEHFDDDEDAAESFSRGNEDSQIKRKTDQQNSVGLLTSSLNLPQPVKTVVIQASFREVYSNFVVNSSYQFLFMYSYREYANQTIATRIRAAGSGVTREYPVAFVARQQEGILSWQVPLEVGDSEDLPKNGWSYAYWSVSRTLCPIDKNEKPRIEQEQLIYVTVSTMSTVDRHFNLSAHQIEDFEIAHGQPKTVTVAASRPQYYMYTFPEGVSTVLITVTSPSDTCMTVSIQKIKCPVFDLDTNVEYDGKYQTMSKKAAMFLEVEDYGNLTGFYVVLITNPNDQNCKGYIPWHPLIPPSEITERRKTVTVLIEETISTHQYYRATFGAVGVFLIFYLFAFIIFVWRKGCGLQKDLDDLDLLIAQDGGSRYEQVHVNPNFRRANGSRSPLPVVEVTPSSDSSLPPGEESFLNRSEERRGYGALVEDGRPGREMNHVKRDRSCPSSPTSVVDERDIDFLSDADEEKEVVRTKTAIFVSDLARKKRTKLAKSYKLFHWNLLTIAIFYGLPVVQLVITYQREQIDTGNQDVCYYNFECAHPLQSYLSSFNNVFSNIGYIMLGILFIFIVYVRDYRNKRMIAKYGDLEKKYGIPQHFGLFYAMGLALIMEGLMSACYHVCPSYNNFQFDTSFMYIIACLCMLKIYQSRHPDINAKAHIAYFSMALIIFIAVIGVVYGTSVFWILYALVHMLGTLVLTAQVYYMGRWKCDRHIFRRIFLVIISDFRHCSRPAYPNRFVLLFFGNIINWAFAIYGAVMQPADFCSFLLGILIGNLLLYTIFYLIMKLLSKERISWLVYVVIIVSSLTWGGSLYFFFQHVTSSQLSPAGSRSDNKPCMLMEFYDSHDVWHFLSAISLFFSFMILLLLDDDLTVTKRDTIPVF